MLRHYDELTNKNADNNNVSVPSVIVNATENDNVYVRELRRMFDSCATSTSPLKDIVDDVENNHDKEVDEILLDQNGLEKLCNELHLQNHRDYIVGQLIPSSNGRLNFETFKIKFIQLLPEIVEFSTSVDETNRFVLESERKVEQSRHESQREDMENGVLHSDNDTSNDILSDFSDDGGVIRVNDHHRIDDDYDVPARRRSSTGTQNNSESSPLRRPMDGVVVMTPTTNRRQQNNHRTIAVDEVEQILSELGLADKGYLGRYELRILCQHLGLNGLTPQELTILFNQLDKDGDGKISVADFLSMCPQTTAVITAPVVNQPNVNGTSPLINRAPPNFPATNGHKRLNGKLAASDTTLTLFNSLDHSKTGHAKVTDLLQYWSSIGVEDGCDVLKKLGIVENHYINLKILCDGLYNQISDRIDDDVLMTAAVLTLKAEILHLRETFDESRDQASFYLRELQQVNQRNSLLVEELDQSQQNLEVRSQMQLRDLEDKHQGRVTVLESKYKTERDQWHTEIRDRDELLHRMQQNEASFQSRFRQLDRENLKLKNEVDDLSQTIKELEDINREMRFALQDASSSGRKHGENGSKLGRSKKWSQVNNNGSIYHSSLHAVAGRRAVIRNLNGPISTPVLAKRPVRRKLLPNETSDFESDPEPLLMRAKMKRPLKKKQRLALVAHRMPIERAYDEQTPSTSSSEDLTFFDDERQVSCTSTANGCCTAISTQLTALEKQLSDERKFLAHELRMEVTTLEEDHEREKHRLINKYEEEKRVLISDFKKQLESLAQKHAKDKQTSLEEQESELKRKFADEKRDLEIRWASERNVAERRFAEEKMAIMERLQNEFETELKRVKTSKVSPASSQSDVSMSHSLSTSEKQRLERALGEKSQLETNVNTLTLELEGVKTKLTEETFENTRLKQLLDEFQLNAEEKHKTTQKHYETANEKLKSEIRRLNDDSQRLLNEIEELRKNLYSNKKVIVASTDVQVDLLNNQDCVDCKQLKKQLELIKNEQLLSTATNETIVDLEAANKDLNERLNGANEHVLELQTYLSVSDSQRLRQAISERRPLEWTSSTESACDAEHSPGRTQASPSIYVVPSSALYEKLKEENFLLTARLTEQRRLTNELTTQLHDQMKETSKVATVAQNFYSKFSQIEGKTETVTDLRNVKESLSELYVQVDRLLS